MCRLWLDWRQLMPRDSPHLIGWEDTVWRLEVFHLMRSWNVPSLLSKYYRLFPFLCFFNSTRLYTFPALTWLSFVCLSFYNYLVTHVSSVVSNSFLSSSKVTHRLCKHINVFVSSSMLISFNFYFLGPLLVKIPVNCTWNMTLWNYKIMNLKLPSEFYAEGNQ